MVIIDIESNTSVGGLTLDPAGMHCPSWDDAFVSSCCCCCCCCCITRNTTIHKKVIVLVAAIEVYEQGAFDSQKDYLLCRAVDEVKSQANAAVGGGDNSDTYDAEVLPVTCSDQYFKQADATNSGE